MKNNLFSIAQTLSQVEPLEVHLEPFRAYLLVALLQLALRHPGVQEDASEVMEVGASMARRLQARLGELDPAIAASLEPGWDSKQDATITEFDQIQSGDRIVVHTAYALYEQEDGSKTEQAALMLSRPPDWGNPNRWHYSRCKVEFDLDGKTYVNYCHLWQQVERAGSKPFQMIAPSLFIVLTPGEYQELCGRSHLGEDDLWDESWGERPPLYSPPDDDFDGYDDDDTVAFLELSDTFMGISSDDSDRLCFVRVRSKQRFSFDSLLEEFQGTCWECESSPEGWVWDFEFNEKEAAAEFIGRLPEGFIAEHFDDLSKNVSPSS
jgi:hypothetical protein